MIVVLMSAYNEAENPFFWKTLETIRLLQAQGLKIKPVVGITPGKDDTTLRLEQSQVEFIEVPGRKRANRYNKAFELASCGKDDWLILNHPRSVLDPEAFLSLSSLPGHYKWGAFTHQFDFKHPLLTFTSWWSNCVRGDLKRIFYLDHCLFIRKEIFERAGGFPDREIFEDTFLSLKLSSLHTPVRLPWKSTTSSIRFKHNGILKQALNNQILKLRYFFRDNDEEMNRDYEKGLDLNS